MSTGKLFKFYNSKRWRKVRKLVLERDVYLCQCDACKKSGDVVVADVVHHVTPIDEINLEEYGLLESNLISMNRLHHEKHHGRYTEDEEDDYYFDGNGDILLRSIDISGL